MIRLHCNWELIPDFLWVFLASREVWTGLNYWSKHGLEWEMKCGKRRRSSRPNSYGAYHNGRSLRDLRASKRALEEFIRSYRRKEWFYMARLTGLWHRKTHYLYTHIRLRSFVTSASALHQIKNTKCEELGAIFPNGMNALANICVSITVIISNITNKVPDAS
jgi:hypothetical protein